MSTLLHRISDKLWVAFSLLFVVVFSLIVRIVMFGGRHRPLEVDHSMVLLILLADLVFIALYMLYSFISKHEDFFKKYFYHFTYGGCILMLFTNIALGFLLRHGTGGDQGEIFNNAWHLVVHGGFSNKGYFQLYPHQIGGVTLLALYNLLGYTVGITDWFGIYVVLHGIVFTLAIFLSILICKRLFGEKQALFALLMIVCFPSMHIMTAFLYTDSFALPFTVFVFYCYLRIRESERISRRIGWAVLLGIAAILGFMIKPTSAVVLVALILYSLLSGHWKILIYGIVAIFVALAINYYADSYYYRSNRLDRSAPSVSRYHFLLTGIKYGRWSAAEVDFSLSFNDPVERDKQVLSRTLESLKARSWVGMAELFNYKMSCLFGDGTFEATSFLKNYPKRLSWVHNIVLRNGPYYNGYALFAQAMYLQFQILMLITAFCCLVSSKIRTSFGAAWVPLLAVFGMVIAESFIEISDYHMRLILLMMVIASAPAMEWLKKFYVVTIKNQKSCNC